jgi:hypothetical protein
MTAILVFLVYVSSNYLHASEDEACYELIDQANKTCKEEICQRIDTGGLTCAPQNVSRIAFAECIYDELQVLVYNYNRANETNYSCEDYY